MLMKTWEEKVEEVGGGEEMVNGGKEEDYKR